MLRLEGATSGPMLQLAHGNLQLIAHDHGPEGFWLFSRIIQPFWATCASVWPPAHLCQAALQLGGPCIYWCGGLFFIRCRTLHFSLPNFANSVSAHFSSLSRSPWIAARPSGLSAIPPKFVSSAKLLRVLSAPSFRSWMKTLNRTGLSTDPRSSPLVTSLQVHFAPLITTLKVCPFIPFSIQPVVWPSSPCSNSLRLFWEAASKALLTAH